MSVCCPAGESNELGANVMASDMSRLDILHSFREVVVVVGGVSFKH